MSYRAVVPSWAVPAYIDALAGIGVGAEAGGVSAPFEISWGKPEKKIQAQTAWIVIPSFDVDLAAVQAAVAATHARLKAESLGLGSGGC